MELPSIQYTHVLSTMPLWASSSASTNRALSLNQLSVNTLRLFPPNSFRVTKKVAIENIEAECIRISSHLPTERSDLYHSFCQAYVQSFGLQISTVLFRSVNASFKNSLSNPVSSPDFVTTLLREDLDVGTEPFLSQFTSLLSVKAKTTSGVTNFVAKPLYASGSNRSKDLHTLVARCTQFDYCYLFSLSIDNLAHVHLSELFTGTRPFPTHSLNNVDIVLDILTLKGYPHEYITAFQRAMVAFSVDADAFSAATARRTAQHTKRRDERITRAHVESTAHDTASQDWPQPVSQQTVHERVQAYRNAIQFQPYDICCCCGSDDRSRTGLFCALGNAPSLAPLRVSDPHILKHTPRQQFKYLHASLDGLLLEPKGIQFTEHATDINLYFCRECFGSLSRSSMPRLALNNHMYRGELPVDLQDVHWIEEMACSIYRNTAHVARIFNTASDEDPLQMHGNTCAHPMNIFLHATSLPWAPSELNEYISVVFVGKRKLNNEELNKLTTHSVRKPVIVRLLNHLRSHHRLYFGLPINDAALDLYPNDGPLPGLAERIVYDHDSNADVLFSEESSSFDQHPAELFDSSESVLLEHTGVYDPETANVPARFKTAAALENVAIASDPDQSFQLHYRRDAVSEYKNRDLFPGMFPTLYPLGIGGFEDPRRSPPVSLESHADHLLDQANRNFRYHHYFPFVVFNLIQRRKAHLHTSLSIKSNRFAFVAPSLLTVSPQVLTNLANHLKNEYDKNMFSEEERRAFRLLQEVNVISTKIPGSQASKTHARREIRSYYGYFGLPHLFLTINPSAVHSPVFQVMFGDESIDLSSRQPQVPRRRSDRACQVAKDPVAAADFIDFVYHAIFKHLFGWDFEKRKSIPGGGIIGSMHAFYGTAELTERGQFHGHYLIWLLGGLNPSEVHSKMKQCSEFADRFFDFFDNVIRYHLPATDVELDKEYEPRVEMPPDAPFIYEEDEFLKEMSTLEWDILFESEHKKIGEKFQRHRCHPVCRKGRALDSDCRFGFPHEIVELSRFESETNSIILARKESDVNGHNPVLLVYTRTDHDLKCILSGRAARAMMFYILDYITKMPLRTEQLLSLLSGAVSSLQTETELASPITKAKHLLHRCLLHFGRGQQLHAQSAIRYLRGLGDTMASHQTIIVPSAALLLFVQRSYKEVLAETVLSMDEELPVKLSLTADGKLQETTQVLQPCKLATYFAASPTCYLRRLCY